MVDPLSVDSIEEHNQVSGKRFPTTGPRIEAGSVVIHRGLHISNVTASCSLCAIGCKELLTERHRCSDVLYIVVMLMGYIVNWNCMSMDFKVLRLGVSFGITRLIRASFGITRLICASFGITRLIGVRVQRGADRRGARRMREGHMDASDFLYASADPDCLSVSFGYTKDQIVLGVPLGSPKTRYVSTGSQIARIQERASSWAKVKVEESWRATEKDP
ncbi:hypothetical protein E5676_scaffold132G00030 [Cucumis melo var. makuwa]|uniref:Ty3-gypsy retrotransposon protein n=1 Tax=Cucumis melo var. makuwa TaxID=1194695 RepID=A0A5D3DAY5_CUCMM|nr:hypothetical protein E5676_scaffold132G00030 [Cucumis melo var. makuwa]